MRRSGRAGRYSRPVPQPAAPAPELRPTLRYSVTTPVFEGPLDLLLHLVTSQQVDLYEVSLVALVDAYVEHLARLQHLDLDVATEFLVIAATLIELKSRRLLPEPPRADRDDELDPWGERDVLLARLIECKTFKDAAAAFEALADEAARSWPRRAGPEAPFVDLLPDVLAGVSPADLRAALVRALTPEPPPPPVDVSHITAAVRSVGEVAAGLRDRLPGAGRVVFADLTAGMPDRMEVIVHFLAVLELYKDGLIDVDQAHRAGDLVITWVGDDEG